MNKNRRMILDTLLLFLSFMLLETAVFGRDFKNSPYNQRFFSVNQGFSFSGNGDGWGTGNEISHLKTFLPRLYHRESISSWLINGQSWIDGGVNHQTGFDFAVELGISPFLMKNRMLSFTLGGCISYQTNYSPDQGGNSLSGDSFKTLVSYRNEKGFIPGYAIGANYYTRVNSNLWLNVRAAIKAYNSGNILSILSVGIGLNPAKYKR